MKPLVLPLCTNSCSTKRLKLQVSYLLSARRRLVLLSYQIVMRALQLVLPIKLAKRARQEPGYAWHVSARMGRYSGPSVSHHPWMWVHAVSLGETRASAALVAALRVAHPHVKLLLTHGTATGLQAGKDLLRDGDQQTWLPWDSASAVNGFLKHYKPRFGVLMETEVWPQLCLSCVAQQVPLFVVNARMSQRSLEKAQRLVTLSHMAFGALAGVVAQTNDDAQRLAVLGANVLGVVGNIKFDMQLNDVQVASGVNAAQRTDKPIVMLASSRSGEEVLWLQAVAQLPVAQRDAVQWMLVPRHPQRVDEVDGLLRQAGWQVSKRSQWQATDRLHTDPTRCHVPAPDIRSVWLGDTLGEMAMYYAMSQVAVLGGSFEPLGGQNLIEAAACGCVVVAGPHTFNFVQATEQAIQAQACVRVENMAGAVKMAVELVSNEKGLQDRSKAAKAWIENHRGAAVRTVGLLPHSPALQ